MAEQGQRCVITSMQWRLIVDLYCGQISFHQTQVWVMARTI